MRKKLSFLVTAALACTMLFSVPAMADADTPIDDPMEIERVEVATGEVSHFTVQADENTPEATDSYVGTAPQTPGIGLRNLIGPDNRYEVQNTNQIPYRYICYTVSNFPNGKKRYGTGFLVSPYKMVTAAYNLYAPELGGAAVNVALAPARNGAGDSKTAIPYGYVHSTDLYYPTAYRTAADKGDEANKQLYDIGCVKVSSSFTGDIGYFGVKVLDRDVSYTGKSVTVAGYPADAENNKPLYKLNKAEGKITNTNTAYLYYTIDTSYGQSGGPVYIYENGKYYVVGIHNHGGDTQNASRKFTPTVMEWFKKY